MTAEYDLKSFMFIKLVRSFVMVFVILTIGFLLINLAPGDPVEFILGGSGFYTPEFIQSVRERFGLDKPMHEKFALYVLNVMRGEFGYSYVYGLPVIEVIAQRVPPTIILMGTQLVFVLLVGSLLGILAASRANSKLDYLISNISLVGISMPIFWLGLLLIFLFSITLGLFPAQGMMSLRVSGWWETFVDLLSHLFLPTLTLFLINLGLVTRTMRTAMLESLRSDYIVGARAKGLPERRVLLRHAFRNSLTPLITLIGLQLGWLLSGAVIVETVFAWPGMGRLLFTSIGSRDYPIVMGIFLIVSIAVVFSNLITELLYAYFDPRIRRAK